MAHIPEPPEPPAIRYVKDSGGPLSIGGIALLALLGTVIIEIFKY